MRANGNVNSSQEGEDSVKNVFLVFHSEWKQKNGMIIRDWEGQRRVGMLMGNNSKGEIDDAGRKE